MSRVVLLHASTASLFSASGMLKRGSSSTAAAGKFGVAVSRTKSCSDKLQRHKSRHASRKSSSSKLYLPTQVDCGPSRVRVRTVDCGPVAVVALHQVLGHNGCIALSKMQLHIPLEQLHSLLAPSAPHQICP